MMTTNEEKGRFCAFAAALFSPPEPTAFDGTQPGDLCIAMKEYGLRFGEEASLSPQLPPHGDDPGFLSVLQSEYARLFGERQERISLVESTYKPWTTDRDCGLVFAASRGLLMGDHALHMLELYRRTALEVPEAYRSMPDHLVLELEFLALLYRFASDEQIAQFIRDHLDWIPDLKKAIEDATPHPFYGTAIGLLQLFLQHETHEEKAENHGPKKIH